MISICQSFADLNDFILSTDQDKTKSKTACTCRAFNFKNWKSLDQLKLNGDYVAWVEQKKYLF